MKADIHLKRCVVAELHWDPCVDAHDIDVEVWNGCVRLSGHVSSYAERWAAEQALERLECVRGQEVELDVMLPASCRRHDAEIKIAAEYMLQLVVNLLKDAIQVRVVNGWITLSGEVQWEHQRLAWIAAIKYLIGIKGVSNQIHIRHLGTVAGNREFAASLTKSEQLDGGSDGLPLFWI